MKKIYTYSNWNEVYVCLNESFSYEKIHEYNENSEYFNIKNSKAIILSASYVNLKHCRNFAWLLQ